MWYVGPLVGFVFLVNSSAGMHLSAKELNMKDGPMTPILECHNHVKKAEEVYYTYLGEPTRLVRKRSVAQRMRIHVHYDSETFPQLKPELRNLIQNVLMPQSVKYFKNTLKVRNVKTPIRLARSCKEPQVYYIKDEPMPYCVGDCSDTPTCGSVKVPAAHLMENWALFYLCLAA